MDDGDDEPGRIAHIHRTKDEPHPRDVRQNGLLRASSAVRDMERDRVKDADLQRRGLIPLRFTDFRVEHDLPGIASDLGHFLGVSR